MPYPYDSNQSRVPRGLSDGGQWTDDDQDGPIKPAFAWPAAPFLTAKTIEAGLALYTWLSARNSYDQQAIIAIKAREYRRSETDSLKVEFVGFLNQDEVDKICQRFGTTQKMTNAAAAKVNADEPNLPPDIYGTRVHSELNKMIKAQPDPNFKSEVSIRKSVEDGVAGSIRIDVFDKHDERDLICVYDIKTGQRGLSKARFDEIKRKVTEAYGKNTRFIISEVRPQVRRR